MDQMELHILVAEKLVQIMALPVVVVYLAALLQNSTGVSASLAMVTVQLEAV